jgi:hypothetical protein
MWYDDTAIFVGGAPVGCASSLPAVFAVHRDHLGRWILIAPTYDPSHHGMAQGH